jgi:ADP-ribose pyrophosphatase YjhB (NUDIX family)
MAELILPHEPYGSAELERRGTLEPQAGYPPIEQRLVISQRDLESMIRIGRIVIPEGPWFINSHSNREDVDPDKLDPIVTIDRPMDPNRTHRWIEQGYDTDDRGLALHPRFRQLIMTTGMYAGPGFSYRYGEQKATNASPRVVEGDVAFYALTKSRFRRVWGLPGGYQDEGEASVDGGFREMNEETGIDIPKEERSNFVITSSFLPASGFRRDTMHSWMTQAFHIIRPKEGNMTRRDFGLDLITKDPHEVEAVDWFSVEEIDGMSDSMMASHRRQVLNYERSLRA